MSKAGSNTTVVDLTERTYATAAAIIDDIPRSYPSQVKDVVSWVVNSLRAIIQCTNTALFTIASRVDKLEADLRVSSTASVAGPPSTATAQPGSSNVATTTSRRPARCTKCHARGHSVTECKTANPAAMRKRVDRNTRLAKEARTYHTASLARSPPSPYPYPFPIPPPPLITPNIAALSADATELRRRAAQSARDKRRTSKRPTTST